MVSVTVHTQRVSKEHVCSYFHCNNKLKCGSKRYLGLIGPGAGLKKKKESRKCAYLLA